MACCYPMELEVWSMKRSNQSWVTSMKQRVQIVMMLNSERVESPEVSRGPLLLKALTMCSSINYWNQVLLKDRNCAVM